MGRLRKVAGHLLRGFVANAIINGRRPAPRLQGPDGMGPSRIFGSGAYYTRRRKRRRRQAVGRTGRRRPAVREAIVVPVEVPAEVPPESRTAYIKNVLQSGLKKGGWLAKRLGLAFIGAGAAAAGAHVGRSYMKAYMDRAAPVVPPAPPVPNFDEPEYVAYTLEIGRAHV